MGAMRLGLREQGTETRDGQNQLWDRKEGGVALTTPYICIYIYSLVYVCLYVNQIEASKRHEELRSIYLKEIQDLIPSLPSKIKVQFKNNIESYKQ